MITGRARLYREPDDQYTLLIFKKVENGVEALDSSTKDLTLAVAFNTARDALAAMPGAGEKHQFVEITTRIA